VPACFRTSEFFANFHNPITVAGARVFRPEGVKLDRNHSWTGLETYQHGAWGCLENYEDLVGDLDGLGSLQSPVIKSRARNSPSKFSLKAVWRRLEWKWICCIYRLLLQGGFAMKRWTDAGLNVEYLRSGSGS
jgi:hypothetical protein